MMTREMHGAAIGNRRSGNQDLIETLRQYRKSIVTQWSHLVLIIEPWFTPWAKPNLLIAIGQFVGHRSMVTRPATPKFDASGPVCGEGLRDNYHV